MARHLQHIRGEESNIPDLKDGEIGITSDSKKLFYGMDGENIEVAKKSDVDTIRSNFPFLVSTFDGTTRDVLYLYLTYDLINFKSINTVPMFSVINGNIADPQTFFFNGTFYICQTSHPSYGFQVAKSSDLIQWDQWNVKMPSGFSTCWAPQFFMDKDGSVYAFVSLSTGETEEDITGTTVKFFYQYRLKLSSDLKSIEEYYQMNFDHTANYIDGQMYIFNDVYYYVLKNEHDKTIELYSANQISADFTYLVSMPFTNHVEGPCLVKNNGKYYCFADEYECHGAARVESDDLLTWQNEMVVGSSDGQRTTHFDIISLSNDQTEIVRNIVLRYMIDSVGSRRLTVSTQQAEYDFSTYVSGTAFKPKTFDAQFIIRSGEAGIIIDQIDNPADDKRHVITLFLEQTTSDVTFKNSSTIKTPNSVDFKISSGNGLLNVPIKLIYERSYWRIEGTSSQQLFTKYIRLADGNNENLAVEDNTLYYTDSGQVATVSGLDLSNVSAYSKIGFVVASYGTGAQITIKNGTGILTPNKNDVVLDKQDVLLIFERVTPDKLFRIIGPY